MQNTKLNSTNKSKYGYTKPLTGNSTQKQKSGYTKPITEKVQRNTNSDMQSKLEGTVQA